MIIYEARHWRRIVDNAWSDHIAYFTTEEDARTASLDAAPMPANAEIPQLEIYDIESWRAKITADHRENGLRKLTAEEREALGL